MKKEVKPIAGDILAILAKFSEGAGIEDISLNSPDTPRRTLQRWLEKLAIEGIIDVSGKARATIAQSLNLKDANQLIKRKHKGYPMLTRGIL